MLLTNTPQSAETDHFVTPAQLCVGLYVHLDLSWSEHPFAFSSFKIKNVEQIATVRALGLRRIRYAPGRSDVQPIAPVVQVAAAVITAPAEAAVPASPAPSQSTLGLQHKRTGNDRLAGHRARVDECERALIQNARIARSVAQNLRSQPAMVREEASRLINNMADSMLLDVDIAIHLMADKIGGESVYHHSLNVSLLSMMLAREMKLPSDSLRAIGLGALFHDAGLAPGISEPQHGPRGCELCAPLGLPQAAMQVIAQHHEHVDGSGFPRRLQAAQISAEAKLVAVVEQFDQLCNPDDPNKALSPHEALSLMYGQQRQRFDNTALMTFVRCMGVYPPGTIVNLSNGTIATVVAVSSTRPLKPTVQLHDAAVPRKHAEVIELEQHRGLTIVGTLRPQQLSPALRQHIGPSQRLTYQFSTEPLAA